MKEEIVKNSYYELHVDIRKNRLYYTIKGYWQSASEAPKNYDDFEKAVEKLTKGFDAVADLREMKPPPEDVANLHIRTQKLAMAKGLSRTADIVDSSLVNIVIKRYDRESNRFKQAFATIEEGEKWLDSYK
ncbi:MAG: hypothetical protein JW984_08295 [Deltaproteobacteria bacterium]|uniref:Uncharacterized protein n=1 Tax=Candidatus Zymogenus saltonus TaxID=2844893 RepID=A0A9D8KF95_9DELT|nr:hypothetical protein [Candidatus Zymogenus saltonus]